MTTDWCPTLTVSRSYLKLPRVSYGILIGDGNRHDLFESYDLSNTVTTLASTDVYSVEVVEVNRLLLARQDRSVL